MTMPSVLDCMDRQTHAVHAHNNLYEVIGTLIDMSVTGAPVIDDDERVVGMITEAECLKLLSEGSDAAAPHGTVGDFMTDAVTVRPDMDIYYVAGLFNTHPNCRRFAVVDADEKLVAVVTRKDILRVVHGRLMSSQAVRV